MKTQIITLESHDDLISVRDRLSWAKTPRILLVWPKYEEVSLRFLDLKVLQRHANSLGAQLGLVTRRAAVKRDAEALHIPVFKSTRAAQLDLWPVPRPRRRRVPRAPRRGLRALRESVSQKEAAWRTSLAGRIIVFSVGVLAFLTVASLFIPRAALTLYPESRIQSVVIPVAASASTLSVSVTGNVPAHTVEVDVSGEQSQAVSGLISVPKSKAQGVARFTNLSQSDVTIPAGMAILTLGDAPLRFITLHATRAPAGPNQFVDVPIEAAFAGLQGNLDANLITVIEGPLGLSMSVTNLEPTQGGSDLQTIGSKDADRMKLRQTMLDDLRHKAETQLRSQLAAGDVLLLDTLDDTQIMEETYNPPEGQPGKSLTLAMKVKFTARSVSAEDLNQLALASLASSAPPNFEASRLPEFKLLNEPVTNSDGVTRFNLKATRTLLRQMDSTQVFALVRGLSLKNVDQKLSSTFSLRKPSEIVITPAWWPWMPLVPFNVLVDVK